MRYLWSLLTRVPLLVNLPKPFHRPYQSFSTWQLFHDLQNMVILKYLFCYSWTSSLKVEKFHRKNMIHLLTTKYFNKIIFSVRNPLEFMVFDPLMRTNNINAKFIFINNYYNRWRKVHFYLEKSMLRQLDLLSFGSWSENNLFNIHAFSNWWR